MNEKNIKMHTGKIATQLLFVLAAGVMAFSVSNVAFADTFSLSNGGNLTVTAGTSAANSITLNALSGFKPPVSFIATVMDSTGRTVSSASPNGISASFSPTTINNLPYSTALSLSTFSGTPAGVYTITVSGSEPTVTGGNCTVNITDSGNSQYPWTAATECIDNLGNSFSGNHLHSYPGNANRISVTSDFSAEITHFCGNGNWTYKPTSGNIYGSNAGLSFTCINPIIGEGHNTSFQLTVPSYPTASITLNGQNNGTNPVWVNLGNTPTIAWTCNNSSSYRVLDPVTGQVFYQNSVSSNQTLNGNQIGTPITKGPDEFSLGCTDQAGNAATDLVFANVNPTAQISASPNPVPYNGKPTITWSCSGTGITSAIGNIFSTSGGKLDGSNNTSSGISQTVNTTYTLVCTNFAGMTSSASATVETVQPFDYALSLNTVGNTITAGQSTGLILTKTNTAGNGTVTPTVSSIVASNCGGGGVAGLGKNKNQAAGVLLAASGCTVTGSSNTLTSNGFTVSIPANQIPMNNGSPATASINVSTLSTTPVGTYTVTISGLPSDATPADNQVTFIINVTNQPVSPYCSSHPLVSGSISNANLTPGQSFQTTCDYGGYFASTASVNGIGCPWSGLWNGTGAVFNCAAPATPNTYAVNCSIYDTSTYAGFCPAASAGSITVSPKQLPAAAIQANSPVSSGGQSPISWSCANSVSYSIIKTDSSGSIYWPAPGVSAVPINSSGYSNTVYDTINSDSTYDLTCSQARTSNASPATAKASVLVKVTQPRAIDFSITPGPDQNITQGVLAVTNSATFKLLSGAASSAFLGGIVTDANGNDTGGTLSSPYVPYFQSIIPTSPSSSQVNLLFNFNSSGPLAVGTYSAYISNVVSSGNSIACSTMTQSASLPSAEACQALTPRNGNNLWIVYAKTSSSPLFMNFERQIVNSRPMYFLTDPSCANGNYSVSSVNDGKGNIYPDVQVIVCGDVNSNNVAIHAAKFNINVGAQSKPPDIPTNVSATASCVGTTPTINVTWDRMTNADSYSVFRNGGMTAINSSPIPQPATTPVSYVDSQGLISGSSYQYAASSSFNGVSSPWSRSSNQVTAPFCSQAHTVQLQVQDPTTGIWGTSASIPSKSKANLRWTVN